MTCESKNFFTTKDDSYFITIKDLKTVVFIFIFFLIFVIKVWVFVGNSWKTIYTNTNIHTCERTCTRVYIVERCFYPKMTCMTKHWTNKLSCDITLVERRSHWGSFTFSVDHPFPVVARYIYVTKSILLTKDPVWS